MPRHSRSTSLNRFKLITISFAFFLVTLLIYITTSLATNRQRSFNPSTEADYSDVISLNPSTISTNTSNTFTTDIILHPLTTPLQAGDINIQFDSSQLNFTYLELTQNFILTRNSTSPNQHSFTFKHLCSDSSCIIDQPLILGSITWTSMSQGTSTITISPTSVLNMGGTTTPTNTATATVTNY